MRKSWALVSLILFSWIGGLGPDARAGVTIDLQFQDMTLPTGITVDYGAVGPGCTFGGYYGRTVSTGYCSDVILVSDHDWISVAGSVKYDTDNDLDILQYREWKGLGVSFNAKGTVQKQCTPHDGIVDTGSQIGIFECSIDQPNNPPVALAGTYRIGTIVWDTSMTHPGPINDVEYISVVNALARVIINGEIVDVSGQVVTGTHRIFMPEPATAALLTLGLVGLTVAARRRRG